MDSLLIALLDKSSSMTDGKQTDEYVAEVKRLHGLNERSREYADLLAKVGRPAFYSIKAKATMDAFNHFLQVMKYRRDACDFYLAQFAGRIKRQGVLGPLEYDVTHNFVDLFSAPPLNADTYRPDGGGTSIYDSILQAIEHAETKIASLPKDERPTQVTMLIQTDGDDTGGKTGPDTAVQKMREMRKQRWNFVFIGTGSIGAHTGSRLGFSSGKDLLEYSYSGAGGVEAFSKAAMSVLESLITGHMEV